MSTFDAAEFLKQYWIIKEQNVWLESQLKLWKTDFDRVAERAQTAEIERDDARRLAEEYREKIFRKFGVLGPKFSWEEVGK